MADSVKFRSNTSFGALFALHPRGRCVMAPSDIEFAVMPWGEVNPQDILAIAPVRFAGDVFVELIDGRLYSKVGGRGLNTESCIAPLTESHRRAWAAKLRRQQLSSYN
jgi:hypothetical protein